MQGLSLVAASGGHSSSRCAGLSLSRPLLLWSTGSRRAGSVVVAHGPSRSAACGIFPDQGSNPCPLHWQADSQPLRHQGSPQSPHFCQIEQYGLLIWFSTLDFSFLPSFISLFLPLLHFMSYHQSLFLMCVPGNSIQVSSTPTQVPLLIPGLLEELPNQSPHSVLSTVHFHSFIHIFT